MSRLTVFLTVSLLWGTLCSAGLARTWKLDDSSLSLVVPEGFEEVSKVHRDSALELFHPKLNTELVISKPLKEKVTLKTYLGAFPEVIKSKGGVATSTETLKFQDGQAALFLVRGLLLEKVETVHVYIVPDKGLPYSLVVNTPAAQSQQTLTWVRALVKAL